MRTDAVVLTREDFDTGVAEQAQARPPAARGGRPTGDGQVDGKKLFTEGNGTVDACGACHTLADAGTTGDVGPNLDEAIAKDDAARDQGDDRRPRRRDRRGLPEAIMPADFAQTLSPEELDALVNYLDKVTHEVSSLPPPMRRPSLVRALDVHGARRRLQHRPRARWRALGYDLRPGRRLGGGRADQSCSRRRCSSSSASAPSTTGSTGPPAADAPRGPLRPRRDVVEGLLPDQHRPQGDRDPVHGPLVRLPVHRRPDGDAHARRARRAGPPVRRPEHVQRPVQRPRVAADLPVHHPGVRRPGELRAAADDRRAGHGVPAPERAVVLAAADRRRS